MIYIKWLTVQIVLKIMRKKSHC